MGIVFRTMMSALVLSAASASAQSSSYVTDNPTRVKGDSDKIVCQKEDKIGTRLGAKKVCLTVAEWQQRARIHQEQTQRLQMGVCVPGEGSCNDPQGEPY